MLLSNSVNKPHDLWGKTWNWLSDDVLYRERIKAGNPSMFHCYF